MEKEWTGLEFGKIQRAVENIENMEENGFEVICGAPTTPAVTGLLKVKKQMVTIGLLILYPKLILFWFFVYWLACSLVGTLWFLPGTNQRS